MILLVAAVSSVATLFVLGIPLNSVSGIAQVDGNAFVVTEKERQLIDRYSRLDEVREILEDEYYLPLEEESLVQGAIDGMLASLEDPYSFYYTPADMEAMNNRSNGVYEGIGIQISVDKFSRMVITRVFANTPAQEAGLQVGDVIVSVDGYEVDASSDKTVDETIARIKGDLEENVKIGILRGEELLELSVGHAEVSMNRVEYKILEDGIGYAMIYEFMGDDAAGFADALEYFQDQNIEGLIVDLRSNPGGLLPDVVAISDMLLPEGLIVYIEDRDGRREEHFSEAGAFDKPLVVLIDENSASASEILAGAVQDYAVGTIVGKTSYGKGIVQTVIPFREDKAGMQLTTARYFTPNGKSIHGVGIQPDIEVDLDPQNPEEDAQLDAAVQEIKRLIQAQQ